MDKSEALERSARVIEKYGFLEGLAANPDFERWQEIGPKAQLKDLEEKILRIQRVEGWQSKVCELIIAYQAIEAALVNSTTMHAQSVKIARDHLQSDQ